MLYLRKICTIGLELFLLALWFANSAQAQLPATCISGYTLECDPLKLPKEEDGYLITNATGLCPGGTAGYCWKVNPAPVNNQNTNSQTNTNSNSNQAGSTSNTNCSGLDLQTCGRMRGCNWTSGKCVDNQLVGQGNLGTFSSTFTSINQHLLGSKFSATQGIIGIIINLLLPWILVIGGLILFGMLVAGGFQILTAVQNPDQAAAGRAKIGAAVVGFLLLFSSFWIAQILQVLSGIKILGS